MRRILIVTLTAAAVAGAAGADDQPKQAPSIVLTAPDGKQTYDLARLSADGPVLVRLTCACSGCDQELPYFQKLQAAYEARGLKTLAAFQEKPEAAGQYVARKDIRFLWVADPKGELWKTFDTKVMPTNILVDRGGRVVKVLKGCTKDGRNAQLMSAEIARILQTPEVQVADPPKK